jgi:murein DD-endopeptidase / murein LD-carboxypeptidase
MKKLFTLTVLLASLAGTSRSQDIFTDLSANDPEQQQLEWCFHYSNLFGYNISYVANPRLYEMVSEWLGTPYRYSGESKDGIDCSGFVCNLYQHAYNKVLEGSAKDIFDEIKPIRTSELREGDLVFFKIKKNRVSHVGIYLGDNKFAHASTQRGVVISDLEDPYYQKYFYKAGRIKS